MNTSGFYEDDNGFYLFAVDKYYHPVTNRLKIGIVVVQCSRESGAAMVDENENNLRPSMKGEHAFCPSPTTRGPVVESVVPPRQPRKKNNDHR